MFNRIHTNQVRGSKSEKEKQAKRTLEHVFN